MKKLLVGVIGLNWALAAQPDGIDLTELKFREARLTWLDVELKEPRRFGYLQPFDDANKRVARLAANMPLIKANLAPMTFEGVPRDIYSQAVLGVNELRRRQLLSEFFIFAYQRSASHYGAVRHLLGEPDPLRWKHRTALRHMIGGVIRGCLSKSQAVAHIRSWSQQHFDSDERTSLRDIAEREILSLHAGNCARYRIHPSEFATWRRNRAGQGA